MAKRKASRSFFNSVARRFSASITASYSSSSSSLYSFLRTNPNPSSENSPTPQQRVFNSLKVLMLSSITTDFSTARRAKREASRCAFKSAAWTRASSLAFSVHCRFTTRSFSTEVRHFSIFAFSMVSA
ncbi:hypothetical protein CFOL_v3_13370 [Cephalotus follicularis]|uniref:Uncharacterized protein n=1 Tax=Cephalotus follicularis TaxID=3775 RepID=A0A1Q3BPR0_CEPFO|nr:hypothetical protein CFOL_v3_13370 [Cephalotus follicularis]